MDGKWNHIRLLTNMATLEFGGIPSGASVDLPVTLINAEPGDVVSLGVPNESMSDGVIYFPWVSAPDTVTVRCLNPTAQAVNVAPGTFSIVVTQLLGGPYYEFN